MKTKLTFTLVAFCFAISVNAQKPFKELGLDDEVEVITLSNGRYIEHFTYDTLRQIGSVMFNTVTGKVEHFISDDDLEKMSVAKRNREVSRFMSIDPMAKSFPWNSPYSYAENDVIRCIDLDGLEKVIVFGGADLMNTGLSKTTLQTAADIQKYSDDNKLGYDVKTFNVAPWNPSQGTAFNWIKENYKEGESIIIYGYSMGGVAANQLAKMLKSEGITVNLLVPVDAAFGPFGQPLQVSDNVETVFNFYQTDLSTILSSGYPAEPIPGNDKSIILNYNYDEKKSVQGTGAHGAMDEDTQKDATNIIKAEMSGKLDGIIQNATKKTEEQ